MDVNDDLEHCPNCGSIIQSEDENNSSDANNIIKCSNCGNEVSDGDDFCHNCGNKIEREDNTLRCESCGSELPKNTLFCPTCGSKVNIPVTKIQTNLCPNCGIQLDNGVEFCPECGTNISTGEVSKFETAPTSFSDKINLGNIIKPTIIALIASIILSLIGLLIGFSWMSFVIAIILAVGFFAGIIDNEANAIVFGFIVGLILGILEFPLVELMFGSYVAGFYDGFFGGHWVLLIILGVIIAYVSNMYLKDNIQGIMKNFKGML